MKQTLRFSSTSRSTAAWGFHVKVFVTKAHTAFAERKLSITHSGVNVRVLTTNSIKQRTKDFATKHLGIFPETSA